MTDYSLDYGSWLKGEGTDNSYNPELAEQILEQNGWEFKYNRWQKTENYYTKTLYFKIVVQASNQSRVNVAEMIKADLQNIGINVTIVKASDSQYQYYLQNKNYDSIITGTTVSANPSIETYIDSCNFNNEELNSLMSEVKNITKEELLKEKYTRIREIFNEYREHPLPLCCEPGFIQRRKQIPEQDRRPQGAAQNLRCHLPGAWPVDTGKQRFL